MSQQCGDGTLLKQLKVADCAYGPHEIRGCIRNDLVKALGDALPEGTIRFGAGVDSIRTTEQGVLEERCLSSVHASSC